MTLTVRMTHKHYKTTKASYDRTCVVDSIEDNNCQYNTTIKASETTVIII
jgi:hypothetical protein